MDFKEIRFYSALISTTVISLNALVIAGEAKTNPTERVWLLCEDRNGKEINCDNLEKYKKITNKHLIEKLEK